VGTESRSQMRNREAALQRVWDELERRKRRRKPRVATKPTRSRVEERLQEKRRTGIIKRDRRRSDSIEE
jgi:ribosome-associated protein